MDKFEGRVCSYFFVLLAKLRLFFFFAREDESAVKKIHFSTWKSIIPSVKDKSWEGFEAQGKVELNEQQNQTQPVARELHPLALHLTKPAVRASVIGSQISCADAISILAFLYFVNGRKYAKY